MLASHARACNSSPKLPAALRHLPGRRAHLFVLQHLLGARPQRAAHFGQRRGGGAPHRRLLEGGAGGGGTLADAQLVVNLINLRCKQTQEVAKHTRWPSTRGGQGTSHGRRPSSLLPGRRASDKMRGRAGRLKHGFRVLQPCNPPPSPARRRWWRPRPARVPSARPPPWCRPPPAFRSHSAWRQEACRTSPAAEAC